MNEVMVGLDEARAIVAAGHQYACECGLFVTIVVADGAGSLVALHRMDGAAPASVSIALSRAVNTALRGKNPNDEAEFLKRRLHYRTLSRILPHPLLPGGAQVVGMPGALIEGGGGVWDGIRGAVGVGGAGGADPNQESACARAAADVVQVAEVSAD